MRVLLVRLDHAGDVVLTVPPLARHFRSVMPAAHVAVLTTSAGESLLRDDPHIDRIHVFDAPWSVPPAGARTSTKLYSIKKMASLLGRAVTGRIGRYDAIVYLSFGPWERALTCFLAGRRIGFTGPYARRINELSARLLTDRVPFDERSHIVDNCLRLADVLAPGARQDPADRLHLDGTQRMAGRAALGEPDGRPHVVVHPGGPGSFKSWPHEAFRALVSRLCEMGMRCTMIMSPGEHREISERFGPPAHPDARYLPTGNLREMAAIMAAADAVVANDGGPCHIAARLGCPLVVIFGPTDERIYGPIGPAVRVLRGAYDGAPCSTPWRHKHACRCTDKQCLRTTGVDDVVHEVQDLLRTGQGPERAGGVHAQAGVH